MKGKYKMALMLLISAFSALVGFNEVEAATLVRETVPNVYYARSGGGKPYGTSFVENYTMDGKAVYCIEPGVAITTSLYYGQTGWVNSPFSTEINRKLQLIGYYGYDYPGHKTQRFRLATQSLIWEVASGQKIELWTEIGGHGSYINVDYERNEIMKLVNAHHNTPSFDNETRTTNVGKTEIFIDNKGVLSNYQIITSKGAESSIDGNTLSVTPTQTGEASIVLKKKTYTDEPTTIFVGSDGKSQKMGFFGLEDPLYVTVKLNALGGKIEITKQDAESSTSSGQGQATLKGAKYNVIDSNNNVVSTLTIGDDLKAITDYLPFGTYTIKEVSAPTGYYLDENTYTITVDASETFKVVVKEQVIKAKIKVVKYDSDNNSCQASGMATLKGAIYEIRDHNGNIVDTLTIGEDCSATSKELPYGKYTVKEKSSPTGYHIDSNEYSVNITNSELITVISKDKLIKSKIKINKVDTETNSCKASGMATLKGAIYEIRDHNGNIVDTLTIGEDCSATSKELPYGKYTIKETKSPTGYYVDENTYNVNINSTDLVSITVKENVIKTRIKIYKVDSETNSCQTSGMETLKGAIYEIRDHNGNIVDTLTIGDDCSATSKELPYGKYTVKEIKASEGYYIDQNTYSVNIENDKVISLTSKEKIIKSKIKINKVDSETNSCKASGMATLKGAIYEIRDHNGNIVDTLTIGDDCSAISKELPYGKYTIKESKASEGYYIDENTYSVNIKNKETITITSKEDVIKGKIKIIKIDSETNSCKALGQSTLVGAKFVIKNTKDEIVDTLTIGEDCSATSKELPYGKYKILEINSPTGYQLNTEVFTQFIKEKLDYTITVKENVIKNYISILKQYDYVDGNTTFLNAEANITFEIYYPDGTKYDEITTDKNGYATINIPYGTWKFHQVNSNTGFEKIYDFYITVDENSEKEQYYNILNNKLSAYLQIVKRDSETGKIITLANTTFKILNTDTNQYVSQFVGGKVLDKFYTDENGISTTYLKLEAGNYKIVEIESPKGYLISNEGASFTIGNETAYKYTTYGSFVVVDFVNTPIKGQVEIYKTGEKVVIEDGTFRYETINLKGVKFELYAAEDIKSSDGNHLYFNKGYLIETLITDGSGYVISKKIPLGKYYLIEVETDSNHILNTNKYFFELTEKDNKTAVVYNTYKAHNYLEKGKLEFTKTDLVEGTVIPNVEINIFTEKDELVFTGMTDENGKIIIDNLFVGKFYIIEKNPATGYVMSDEKIYFQINENNEIVKAKMTNKKITSTLKVTKIDEDGLLLEGVKFGVYDLEDNLISEHITDENGYFEVVLDYGKYYLKEISTLNTYVISNEKIFFEVTENEMIIEKTVTNKYITGTLELSKIDLSTSEPLPNTKIEIYTENDELVFSGVTDEDGMIVIEGLRYGKYYIIEKEAPEGYILSGEKMFFEIKENSEIVKATMTNEMEIIEVPNTSSNSYVIFIPITMLGIGLILLIIGKKKNKKEGVVSE